LERKLKVAKKVISYKINQDGTVPFYVEDGGYLANHSSGLFNAIFIGVSKDGVDLAEAETIFDDETSLIAYVDTYMSGLVVTNPITKEEHIFNSAPTVSDLFAKVA
jgi:hypothetical protein